MRSFDDIKAILEDELQRAMNAHESSSNPHHTGVAMARAIQRYKHCVLHGTIPDDLADEAGEA